MKMPNLRSSRSVRVALFIIDLFVALTAIGGSIALVAGLEDNRFPLAWLKGTPFTNLGRSNLPGAT